MALKFGKAFLIGGLVVFGSIGLGAAVVAVMSPSAAAKNAETSTDADVRLERRLAATVNGAAVSESEIAGLTAQGLDRAVAVDRYVNVVLAAELARKAYSADAEAAVRGAERDALSRLYVQRRTEEIRARITDAEVASFYDTRVDAADYAKFKVRFFVTQDPREAEGVAAAVAAGKAKDVEGRFEPAKAGDGLTTAAELPYGLGQVVRGMKAGEYSRALMLRNGVFVLRVDEVHAGQKPDRAAVTAEIRDRLVGEHLNAELSQARRSARIELK